MRIILSILLCCCSAFAGTYSTTFSGGNANPISEGGNWINGYTTGKQWSDVQITNGLCCNAQLNAGDGNSYNDGTAILSGSWGATQYVSAAIWFNASKITNGSAGAANQYREIELRLRSSITASNCTGYEIDFSFTTPTNVSPYIYISKWNGAFGSFTDISGGGVHGTQYQVQNGDVVSASVTNSTIKAFINGTNVLTATDSTFTTGSPGVGFDMSMNYSDVVYYGYTNFYATDFAPSPPSAVFGISTAGRISQ